MDFLRYQAATQEKGREEGRFGAVGLDDGDLLFAREIVATVRAFPGGGF